MIALVLEKTKELSIRDIPVDETMGPDDVTIKVHTVGICGSDVHYYEYGGIGNFIVKSPMILGHEASGTVVSVGKNVKHLKKGDRVCMEPGIPDKGSREYRKGRYNIDPGVVFWATPPVHGCLRTTVVHPADFTFKLPDNVSYAEGALVEPFAVGVHAVGKAATKIGDTVLVIGAGTIGVMTSLSALAAGAGKVILTDISAKRLEMAKQFYPRLITVDSSKKPLKDSLRDLGIDAIDAVFEASGAPRTLQTAIENVAPGGCIVQIGCPVKETAFQIGDAQAKEVRMEFIFRYAHVYPKVLELFGSERVDLKPLISRKYAFGDSVKAFEDVCRDKEEIIKAQIVMPE